MPLHDGHETDRFIELHYLPHPGKRQRPAAAGNDIQPHIVRNARQPPASRTHT